MHFPEFRSTKTKRKRTAVAAVLAVALGGGLLVGGATQASAAPSADCRVQGPAQGSDAAWTDPNSNLEFTNVYWCETQQTANVHPPSDHSDTTAFGVLNASPAGVQNNAVVCWSYSLPTQSTGGYYWMLTQADAALAGREDHFDIDPNRADASADRTGWISSEVLGIKAGERPLNIAECGSAVAGSTIAEPTLATERASSTNQPASTPTAARPTTRNASDPAPAQPVRSRQASESDRLYEAYKAAEARWLDSQSAADWPAVDAAWEAWQDSL